MVFLSQAQVDRLHTLCDSARHGIGHVFTYATAYHTLSAIREIESVHQTLSDIRDILESRPNQNQRSNHNA